MTPHDESCKVDAACIILLKIGTIQVFPYTTEPRIDPGVILEVQQDYGPIASSVASSRLVFLRFTIAGSVALLLLLPLILWAAARGLNGEHDRLLYLYRTGQAIRSTLELTDVLEQLARDAALFTRAHLAFATLIEESDDLILKASFVKEGNTAAQHHRK